MSRNPTYEASIMINLLIFLELPKVSFVLNLVTAYRLVEMFMALGVFFFSKLRFCGHTSSYKLTKFIKEK